MIATDFTTKIGCMVKRSLMVGIIRIFKGRSNFEIIQIVVTEEILGIEKGHTAEIKVKREIIKKDLMEIGNIQDVDVEED